MNDTGRNTAVRKLARVVVVDDHPFFRDGLSRGLRQSGYLDVVGEAGSGREGLELIRELQPNVAVLDYQMPDLDGLDVVHAIVRDGLPTRALILSALTDSAVVFRALEEGAQGYLSKESRRAEIVDAVLRVAKGETVVPPELAAGLACSVDHNFPADRASSGSGKWWV
jgi:two-component system nitrate/nitrite response regulator NarL